MVRGFAVILVVSAFLGPEAFAAPKTLSSINAELARAQAQLVVARNLPVEAARTLVFMVETELPVHGGRGPTSDELRSVLTARVARARHQQEAASRDLGRLQHAFSMPVHARPSRLDTRVAEADARRRYHETLRREAALHLSLLHPGRSDQRSAGQELVWLRCEALTQELEMLYRQKELLESGIDLEGA